MSVSDDLVLLDTNVFAFLFIRPTDAERRGHPVDDWRTALTGYRVVISFQTRAEILYGALKDNWGESRLQKLDGVFRDTPTIWVDDEVVRAEASLREASRQLGHALVASEHTADRWIGACAVAKKLPLWSLDGKAFDGAPLIRRFEV